MAAVSSPFASPLSAIHQEASSFDDLAFQQSLLLSDGLKGLRNMRSQLYSAADYFELSYINDDRKEIVMRTLKEYAVEAIVNAVDHLGSVSYKVNNLINEEVDEVSVAESEVSCIEQRLRTCQACIDQEGLSQQSLSIRPPKYHKHYILQGESVVDPGAQPLRYEGYHTPKEYRKPPKHHSVTKRRQSPMRNPRLTCPAPSLSPSLRDSSLTPPPHSIRSTSPLPQSEKIASKERRATSPVRASAPLMRARSVSNRPTIPHSSKQNTLETQNSVASLHADRNTDKLMERNPTKKRGFLKGLLRRNKSWTDESLYSYLDEY